MEHLVQYLIKCHCSLSATLWSYAAEVFLIQAIALIRLRSDDLQGTDHHPVILQDPPHFPAGQAVFLPLLPTLRIEHEINPQATVAFLDPHYGYARRVAVPTLVQQTHHTPRCEATTGTTQGLIEIRDSDKATHWLSVNFGQQGKVGND